MAEPEIRYLGDLQRLEIKEGDRFVLTVTEPISYQQVERLRENWKKSMGADCPLVVLGPGMKLGAIGKAED